MKTISKTVWLKALERLAIAESKAIDHQRWLRRRLIVQAREALKRRVN